MIPRIVLLLALSLAVVATPARAQHSGDPVAGAKVFRKCQSCHEVGEGARHKTGPHLNDLFGRRAGGLEDFEYSRGLIRAGLDGMAWDRDKLDIYLENPKSLVSGTNMRFRGLKSVEDRHNVIVFLRQYSVSPADIPESAPTAYPEDPEIDAAILAIEGDRDYGAYLSSECTTCHQSDGDDEGIPSITGWPEGDFVIAMHAYKSKARVHPVMQMMAGRLSNEEIAGLAAYFSNPD